MNTPGNFGQRHARSQPPLARAPPCRSVQSLRTKRPILQSSRHTGEVARRAGGGKPQSRDSQISGLKFSEIARVAFPPPPSGAPPP
jgi:hypothetical protein